MSSRVWLIGGTSDSVAIARVLAELNAALVITIATASAQGLYTELPSATQIVVGCMDSVVMQSFCQQHQIRA
ncbi:MAG: precorrin-6A/cobalt-precorrin-6A reductase, partial [Cyanobacteria bacterium J06555_3]